ncbi:MAG: 1-acyl-sn-glycerol-3-phosphate acyltransferase [Dysosmobacter sp.]
MDLPSAASGHGSGLENLPRHGALLVANHASNWDPLVLATALPMDYRSVSWARRNCFRIPFWHGSSGWGRISREPGRCDIMR